MIINSKTKKPICIEDIHIFVSFLIVFIVWVFTFLYSMGIFSKVILFPIIFLILIFIFVFIKNKNFQQIKKFDIIVLVIILFFSFVYAIYSHETFYGGRDDGIYANQAYYLSTHKTIYLNNHVASTYPGHIPTKKGIVFPSSIGYIAYLALMISLFGMKGISLSNFVLSFIGLFSLYFISKKISNNKLALFTVVLFATSYPAFWFFRKTFTENMAFMLVWFGILLFIKLYEEEEKNIYLIPLMFTLSLLLNVRVESFIFFFLSLSFFIYLYFFKSERWLISKKIIILFIISIIPPLYNNLFLDTHNITLFFVTIKNFFANLLTFGITSTNSLSEISTTISNRGFIEYHLPAITWSLLSLYGFTLLIIFIPLSLFKSVTPNFNEGKKKLLIILILVFPQFFYLLNPSISLDQPWFLRRFLTIILPCSFLFFSFYIQNFKKKIILFLFSLILVTNIVISAQIITFSEFNGTIEQISKINKQLISHDISKNDLILIDYDNLGHYKLAEPLFYLFDYNSVAILPSSINKLIILNNTFIPTLYSSNSFIITDICNYSKIYFLVNKKFRDSIISQFNESAFIYLSETKLVYTELLKECEIFRLTQNKTLIEMAHLDIGVVKSYCTNTPQKFLITNISIELLRLDDSFVKLIKKKNCKNNQTFLDS